MNATGHSLEIAAMTKQDNLF